MSTTTVGRRVYRRGRKVSEIMSSSAPQPAQPQRNKPSQQQSSGVDSLRGAEFERFVDGAFRDHVVGTTGLPSAGDLEPRQLLRYAAGKTTEDERTALEDFVKRSRWAYDRVMTLVRAKRPDNPNKLPGSIARRLLENPGNRTLTVVGQAILEVEGIQSKSLEDAWKKLEKDGSEKTRAACLIGLGRHDEARKLIEDRSAKDPVWTLLRRVSAAALESKAQGPARMQGGQDEDDAALLALLDVLPSLA